MAKFTVEVSGLIQTSEWYDVEAEDTEEAEDKAVDLAESEGFDDPMPTGRTKKVE